MTFRSLVYCLNFHRGAEFTYRGAKFDCWDAKCAEKFKNIGTYRAQQVNYDANFEDMV